MKVKHVLFESDVLGEIMVYRDEFSGDIVISSGGVKTYCKTLSAASAELTRVFVKEHPDYATSNEDTRRMLERLISNSIHDVLRLT